jgi:hypothetical protein
MTTTESSQELWDLADTFLAHSIKTGVCADECRYGVCDHARSRVQTSLLDASWRAISENLTNVGALSLSENLI